MPTWLYGIGAVLIMMLRRPILSWAFGLFKREAASLLRVAEEERLQWDVAAAREAAARQVKPAGITDASTPPGTSAAPRRRARR